MERRFIKIFEKPHFIFWGAIPLLLIISFIKKGALEDAVLDINIHDTYFVIAYYHFTFLISLFVAFIGFIYYLLYKFKIKLNLWLNTIHALATIIAVLFLIYPFSIIPTKQYEGFPKMPSDTNTEVTITFLLIIIAQLILLINVIQGIVKLKRN